MSLALAVAFTGTSPITGTVLKGYGRWIVDCTMNSLDNRGRVQCSAQAEMAQVAMFIQHRGDEIQTTVRSRLCPGIIMQASIDPKSFKRSHAQSILSLSGRDKIIAAAIGFRVHACRIPTKGFDGDSANLDRALTHVLSRKTPDELSVAIRNSSW